MIAFRIPLCQTQTFISKYWFAAQAKLTTGLNRKQINRHFNSKPTQALQQVEKIHKKYPHFVRNDLNLLFKLRPELFKPGDQAHQRFIERLQLIYSFEEKYAKILSRISGKNLKIMCQMTDDEIKSFVSTAERFGMTDYHLQKILLLAFNVVNRKFSQIMEEKFSIFDEYLHLSKEQFLEVMVHSPFLLPSSTQRFKETVLYFLGMKVPIEKIESLMKQMGETFLIGKYNLIRMHSFAKGIHMTSEEFIRVYFENPLLFMNCPHHIWPYKLKLFKYFKFDKRMLKQMFLNHPAGLIWSIKSLQAKLIFFTERMNFTINPTAKQKEKLHYQHNTDEILELLTYKFNKTLRPRGQILAKIQNGISPKAYLENLKITQAQFVDKYAKKGFPLTMEKFVQEKARFRITDQIDYRFRKTLLHSHRYRVFKQKSANYDPTEKNQQTTQQTIQKPK